MNDRPKFTIEDDGTLRWIGPSILVDVGGGAIRNVYLPDGLEVEVEIRDWDTGTECEGCGKYLNFNDPDAVVTTGGEFLCLECAEAEREEGDAQET